MAWSWGLLSRPWSFGKGIAWRSDTQDTQLEAAGMNCQVCDDTNLEPPEVIKQHQTEALDVVQYSFG